MQKWTVVVAIVGDDAKTKASLEHEVNRADQAAAIEAALGRQLPCVLEPTDQLLIYAEPFEAGADEAPSTEELVRQLDIPRPYGSAEDKARWKAKAEQHTRDVAANLNSDTPKGPK